MRSNAEKNEVFSVLLMPSSRIYQDNYLKEVILPLNEYSDSLKAMVDICNIWFAITDSFQFPMPPLAESCFQLTLKFCVVSTYLLPRIIELFLTPLENVFTNFGDPIC